MPSVLSLTPDHVDWLPTEQQAKHDLSCKHRLLGSPKPEEEPNIL